MKLNELGKHVLGTILVNNNSLPGFDLRLQILETTGRSVSFGALYACLDKLEAEGMIAYVTKDGAEERGGRPQRFYEVTGKGRTVFLESRQTDLRFIRATEGLA